MFQNTEEGVLVKLKQYFDLLPQCMLNYQFIEEGLRFCLYRQHAIVEMRVKTILPYKPPLESIQNAAMGKLISYFQTFCDNKGLLESLNKVKTKRDRLAHQGYLMTFEEQNDPTFVSNQLIELESAYKEAKACFSALQGEMERIHSLAETTVKT
jgi:hypothetical protein